MLSRCRALLLSCLVGCGGGATGDVPVATATRGDLEITLAVPGELRAVRSITISAPDLGGNAKVTSIVDEGTRVAEGDLLVEFDQNDLLDALASNKSDLEVAETKMEQVRAQLDVRLKDLESAVTRAELELERAGMRTTESETVALVDRESAKIDVAQSSLALTQAKAALESARLQSQSEIQLLELEAAAKRASVTRAEKRLAETTIRAPTAGLVILPEVWKSNGRSPVAAGDTLWGGSTVMELPDLSELEVEAWVHEVDAGRVAVGQPVSVVIDAYPDPPWAGKLTKVADLAVKRNRDDLVKHVKVTARLDTRSDIIKPGMTVRVEVEVGRVKDALTIPLEAVFYQGEDASVFKKTGISGWERGPVTLGERNDTHVVVLTGLAEGDVVALVDPDRFAAGEAAPAGSAGGKPAGEAAPKTAAPGP